MLNSGYLVSILIVTYNAENFIQQTMKSCLSQLYKDIEILVLDNASNDRTVEIIKNINDSRISLFEKKENVGPYSGLNFLLDKAQGKYIAIQDHDDVWLPEKITRQVEFLEKDKGRVACGTGTYYFYEDREMLILDEKDEELNFVDHTSLLFRNDGYRYDTNHLLADEYLEKVILGGNKEKIHCLKDGLTIHRIRSDRHNFSRNRFIFNVQNFKDYFSTNGISPRSFVNLIGVFVAKYFPVSFEWFIIDRIVKRKSKKISLADFQKIFPQLF